MSGRRQGGASSINNSSRLYSYLSGSEGDEADGTPPSLNRSSRYRYRAGEPQYQQPYGLPIDMTLGVTLCGDTPTAEDANSDATCAELEMVAARQLALPVSHGDGALQDEIYDSPVNAMYNSLIKRTPSGSLCVSSGSYPYDVTNTAAPTYKEGPRYLQRQQIPVDRCVKRADLSQSIAETSSRSKRSCCRRCSWKCVALLSMFVSSLFVGALSYLIVSRVMAGGTFRSQDHITGIAVEEKQPPAQEETTKGVLDDTKDPPLPRRTLPPDGTTFERVSLGDKMSRSVAAYGYWNMQLYQSEASYVKFDLTVERGANFGLYARRDALPTHTHYDVFHVVNGSRNRNRRTYSVAAGVDSEILVFMDPGHWFISLYNDDADVREVSCLLSFSRDMALHCPRRCSGNGECILGRCRCRNGYSGEDCSQSFCPVLCNGRGEYLAGECVCNPGWKGKECQLRREECRVADCNGNGYCLQGECVCNRGFRGESCDIVDCPDPSCSSHGQCISGSCLCKKGWRGPNCAEIDSEALQCLPECSGHGFFSLPEVRCICNQGWTGEDCSKVSCDLDCGQHGRCEEGSCKCDPGWNGPLCNEMECDHRCREHGVCRNGTCACYAGWNGKYCTLEGCPGNCTGHGMCVASPDGGWACRCEINWTGSDCSVMLESQCEDGMDNDQDGLTDCEDPDCCPSSFCRKNSLCATVVQPTDVLLRKQPPAVTASFFERMKFMVEEGSLQKYAKLEAFNETRVAVVRGRVITLAGAPLPGVRVSTGNPLEGFTLTRDDGWFDLMVHGGGSLSLYFSRNPFRSRSSVIYAPWNEITIMDTVVLAKDKEAYGKKQTFTAAVCEDHDYNSVKPVIWTSWKHDFRLQPSASSIIAETQAVQETIAVPGSQLMLLYHSSRSSGYLSKLDLRLTPSKIPKTLSKVHLRVSSEGILFEKQFEADSDLEYTFAWNKLNVYRQKVYGLATVLVKVGYGYTSCMDIIWSTQTAQLQGHDMSISDIGGWNFDIHHRYNFREGILQKGDGTNIFHQLWPESIRTVVGDGHQRSVDCRNCNGTAAGQRVLAPVALCSAADGSVYLGDFNLVRRIDPDGSMRTLLRLNASKVAYRYHMALSPAGKHLYISDPEAHQIIRVKNVDDYSDPDGNWEPVIGTGERCSPSDESKCGDGGPATDAKLIYPKGIAISPDSIIYLADGTSIRMVDKQGIIHTLTGDRQDQSHWKPIPCEGILHVKQARLRWPTELAIHPLDDSLHFIDDQLIIRVTPDSRVQIVAGRPQHCPEGQQALVSPQSFTFSPNGDIYVVESDSQRVNRIRRITTDGQSTIIAGVDSKCSCLDPGCNCFDESRFEAKLARFSAISSVTVAPDGVVYVADQGNFRIRSISTTQPEADENRMYEIHNLENKETYVFNRYGQHVITRNSITGRAVYTFTYNVNTSNGKLRTVTDSAGNKIFLLRDPSNQVTSIEDSRGHKSLLKMSRGRLLQEFTSTIGVNVTCEYNGSSGLLKSTSDSTGRSQLYYYDDNGRLVKTVTPTGKVVTLRLGLGAEGAEIEVLDDSENPVEISVSKDSVRRKRGQIDEFILEKIDGTSTTRFPYSHSSTTELNHVAMPNAGSRPFVARRRFEISGQAVNRLEWRSDSTTGTSKLRINGEKAWDIVFDRVTSTEAFSFEDRGEFLNVTYDETSRPVLLSPKYFEQVQSTYDRYGRLTQLKQGRFMENYSYDRSGRLELVHYADESKLEYRYRDPAQALASHYITEEGRIYQIQYDDIGYLRSITTPRGHIHSMAFQYVPGSLKFLYYSPTSVSPLQVYFDGQGRITCTMHPGNSGREIYIYDRNSRIDLIIAGQWESKFSYYAETGLTQSIHVKDRPFGVRAEFQYYAGLIKEERIKFTPQTPLQNAVFRYSYDANARLALVDVNINDKEQPHHSFVYSSNDGRLEGVSDVRIYHSGYNRTVMQDSTSNFFRVIDIDSYGRISKTLFNIKGFDVFKYDLEYDVRGRVIKRTSSVNGGSATQTITYNAEGKVRQSRGQQSYEYVYDDNGNVIVAAENVKRTSYAYDSGDRVVSYDTHTVTYDQRGHLIQSGGMKFKYNSRGHLSFATIGSDLQVRFYYDHRDRLTAWVDDQGNVTQYFYANPLKPRLVTHQHKPVDESTVRFFYDDNDVLVAMETEDTRFYVVCDEAGSPVSVFNVRGSLVKLVERTPFGRVVKDTNPSLEIAIDFHGGLRNPHAGFIHFGNRVYDPTLMQWTTPNWESLAKGLRSPLDVFTYRFRNNDPVNYQQDRRPPTTFTEWLGLLGLSWNSIDASRYTAAAVRNDCADGGHIQAPAAVQCTGSEALDSVTALGLVNIPLWQRRDSRHKLPQVGYEQPALGSGILLSRVKGRAMVHTATGSNTSATLQATLASLLNGSVWLDIRTTRIRGGQDVLYFIKEEREFLREDVEKSKLLSGLFNASFVDTHSELQLVNSRVILSISYGIKVDQARHRILRLAHRDAVEAAWKREKLLLQLDLPGQVDWTLEEEVQLLTNGEVEGYVGADLHSIYQYPQLADDPGNIVFRREQ